MPKQVIEIRNFTKGMVTNADVTDVQLDTPVYNEGLETLNHAGALIGSPVDEFITSGYKVDQGIPTQDHDLRDAILVITKDGSLYWFYNLYDNLMIVNVFDSTTSTASNTPEAEV